MRKLTTAEFIEKAKSTHGGAYDYTYTQYVKSDVLTTIHCTTHGPFSQRPNDHLRGQGCPKCGKVSGGLGRRVGVEAFIRNAREVHGDAYDYSKVVYINTHTHVTIVCPKHGEFSQKPNTHVSAGCGCPTCAKENHPGRYIERRFGASIPLDTPGVFYVIRFSNVSETFIKIGITATSAKQRHTGKHAGYDMTILDEQQMTLYQALLKETAIKDTLAQYRYVPHLLKEGHTECFTEDILPLL